MMNSMQYLLINARVNELRHSCMYAPRETIYSYAPGPRRLLLRH
jgi:hypothetical protein